MRPVRGPGQFSSRALAINADALPAPMTIVRPLGGRGRCAGMRCDGDAAATAASNIALSTLRGSTDMELPPRVTRQNMCPTPRDLAQDRLSNVSVVSGSKRLTDGFGDLLGGRLATEIGRVQLRIRRDSFHGLHQPIGGPLFS